jgi:plasmid stability protein
VEVLNCKAPPDLAQAVRERAAEADRTVSAEIRRALRQYLSTPNENGATAANGDPVVKRDAPARHHPEG